MRRAGEALHVLSGTTRHPALGDQQRTCLEQIPGWRRTELIAPGDPHLAAADLHARPQVAPGRVKGQRRTRSAIDLDLSER